jgi:hypothetical protein
MINEHDCVVLTQNVPEEGVMAGDVGTVVHMWKSHWWRAKENPEDWTVHDHFRKLMRGRGNAPRDWLYAFMRHWLAALLDLERPDLYQCLPEDFNLGHGLPPGLHPLIRRKGCVPTLLPKPRPWDARRVLEHRRWVWLGSSPGGREGADVAERGPRHRAANRCGGL